jgi:hypothetical protein
MGKNRPPASQEMLQGTLDMLILQTLIMGPAHGHTIAHVIEHSSEDVLQVSKGRSIPRCIVWPSGAGSARIGALAKTTARPSITS